MVGADPRVDAVRGCVALERGPLVYAVEQVDQRGERRRPAPVARGTSCRERTTTTCWTASPCSDAWAAGTGHRDGWPFTPSAKDGTGDEVDVVAVPYYAWANREIGAMRVWLPRA